MALDRRHSCLPSHPPTPTPMPRPAHPLHSESRGTRRWSSRCSKRPLRSWHMSDGAHSACADHSRVGWRHGCPRGHGDRNPVARRVRRPEAHHQQGKSCARAPKQRVVRGTDEAQAAAPLPSLPTSSLVVLSCARVMFLSLLSLCDASPFCFHLRTRGRPLAARCSLVTSPSSRRGRSATWQASRSSAPPRCSSQ